jgi:LDH2 family malate/lactate/ureidoglycolate dehydrogenase
MSDMRVQSAALKAYAQEIMRACGVDEEQIQSVSDNLIWCELVGRPNFGVQRLPIHMKRVKCGVLSCPCHLEFRKVSDSIDLLDGGRHSTTSAGTDGARHRAGEARAWHRRREEQQPSSRRLLLLAARAGMVLCSAAPFRGHAHGGIAGARNKPFAFAAPRQRSQPLLDMATSSLAGSVRERIETGEPLPPAWRPTRAAIDHGSATSRRCAAAVQRYEATGSHCSSSS